MIKEDRPSWLIHNGSYVVDVEMRVKARISVKADDKEEAIDEAVAQFMEHPQGYDAEYEFIDAEAVEDLRL